jgi:hypothetical protein
MHTSLFTIGAADLQDTASNCNSHMWLEKCLLKLVDSGNEQASLHSAVTKLKDQNGDPIPVKNKSAFCTSAMSV